MLKLQIAAAYDLNPRTISGGPAWIGTDHYDILAVLRAMSGPTTMSRCHAAKPACRKVQAYVSSPTKSFLDLPAGGGKERAKAQSKHGASR